MSKFGNLINQAKGKSSKTENKEKSNIKLETKSKVRGSASQSEQSNLQKYKDVNLSIKVPENLRRHWVAEAKRRGTSITAEVTAALNEKFGKPDYQ